MVAKYANIIIISLLSCIVILLSVLTYSTFITDPPQDVISQTTQDPTEYDYKWFPIEPVTLIANNRMNYEKQISPDIIHFPGGWEYVAPLHSGLAGVEYILLRRPKSERTPFKRKIKKERYDSSSQKLRDWKNAEGMLDMTIGPPK